MEKVMAIRSFRRFELPNLRCNLEGFMIGACATWLTVVSTTPLPVLAQTMGARSSSTGQISIPVTTTDINITNYGSRNLMVINQSGSGATGGLVVPTFSINLPELPRATQPDQLFSKPKSFDPDLGPFEANR